MKILLVDDEEDIRKIARLSLVAVGKFDVVAVGSAAEALAAAREGDFGLVLLDMMMPGTDGLATLAELRRDPGLQAIPVIFMTAKVQSHEVAHYLAMGARGVIHKPFDPLKLSDQIRAILAT